MFGRIIVCCGGGLLLTTLAGAAEKQPHLKIIIETVEHQRYPTAGDWQVKPDGLHITVSKMTDQRYEVDVRLIADRSTPCGRGSGIEPLAAAGVPIWIDDRARIAHAKTMVVDGDATLMGSMNWTHGAARNSEDLNLVDYSVLAFVHEGTSVLIAGKLRRRNAACQ